MIKEIVTYPTPPSVAYGTDVRIFNEEIFSLIQDMKDTIEANSLDGLSSFQIGSYFNIVVVKQDDGEFLELINPRLISNSGKSTTTEKTAYFPDLTAEITRFETVGIIYQDRDGNQHSLKASGPFSILLQRKIDYTHGSSFITKLSKTEKKIFEKKLKFGSNIALSEVCPTTFKRDYIIKAINILMIAMVILLVSSVFLSKETKVNFWNYELYAALLAVVLNIIYFFYAQYEGKRFTSCTSCQIGNIIGTAAILLIKLSIITLVSYFLLA